ncbi:MAG: DUF4142 domain-containing protein [Myxococcales bacterium]|nr:DUF4142 domain-containing protein [Myxococcales bacterium]
MSDERREHGKLRHAADRAQDMAGGLVGRMSAATVRTADAFVENASMGDLYELEAANVALRRSGSLEVHAIAQQMIEDHGASARHLSAALEMNETRGVRAPPQELDKRHRKMIEHLEAAPKDQFDTSYLDQQVLAHEETETLLAGYEDKGDNPQLRSLAAAILPVVRRHGRHVQALRKELAH